MKIRALGYALILLAGCATLNEVESACTDVTITISPGLQGKLEVFRFPCKTFLTPSWQPLAAGPVGFMKDSRVQIRIKRKPWNLLDREIGVDPIHISCTDTPKPHCDSSP